MTYRGPLRPRDAGVTRVPMFCCGFFQKLLRCLCNYKRCEWNAQGRKSFLLSVTAHMAWWTRICVCDFKWKCLAVAHNITLNIYHILKIIKWLHNITKINIYINLIKSFKTIKWFFQWDNLIKNQPLISLNFYTYLMINLMNLSKQIFIYYYKKVIYLLIK